MIGYLEGTLFEIDERSIIIKVGGVGYEVEVPGLDALQLVVGETVQFYIYTHVREDALELYGFSELYEKKMFLKLITVSSIGPRTALNLLSAASAAHIARWLQEEDQAHLTKLPGVGPKTAQRMILELKDKLDMTIFGVAAVEAPVSAPVSKAFDDVIEALQALGYQKSEIDRILPYLEEVEPQTETALVRQALKLLAKER